MKGSRFVNGNVIIRVVRILKLVDQADVPNPLDSTMTTPTKDTLEMVDKSGTWLIEVLIRTEDGPSPSLKEKASNELLKFAGTLEGAIDLRPANRLSLDMTVKAS